ncbi:hypothetical protein Cgig2_030985 [Carnegiea gigantea]|uniref:START domain-containing protein n=1 Tax=Carnegiea gigantea TaxID=171969 RepID=A0A9Q1QL84_9CARY|nr:hypothetical protein Cgig2_030985 [Carnegiea gigantea]
MIRLIFKVIAELFADDAFNALYRTIVHLLLMANSTAAGRSSDIQIQGVKTNAKSQVIFQCALCGSLRTTVYMGTGGQSRCSKEDGRRDSQNGRKAIIGIHLSRFSSSKRLPQEAVPGMRKKQPANNVLRSENDRVRRENIAIQEVLKKMICPSCGSPPLAEEESMQSLEKLRQENLELRQEFDRVSTVLANYMGRQGSAFDKPNASGAGQGSGNPIFRVDSLIDDINTDEFCLAYPMEANPETTGIANNAMRELIKLLRMDEPLWIKSSVDDHLVLDHESYKKIIPQSAGPRFLRSRRESSKDTGVVNMDARLLVDLYLDRDEWVHHFPTAVSRARTIRVLAAGYSGTRSGSLQLQIETGIWVIADVSCDLIDNCAVSRTSCWKHPSGFMIKYMSNGRSKSAEIFHGGFYIYHHSNLTGRRSMVMLAFRMVRSYCSVFSCLSTTDLQQLSQLSRNGVQIALRKSTCPGQPIGIVILAACTFWVPASPLRISKYLSDHKIRSQWDVLCYGNHVFEITRIPTGRHSVNHISVLQALNPTENVIFQESIMEPSGALIVYAPIHASIVSQLAMGMDSTTIPILASGFAVNTDGPGQRAALAATSGIPWSRCCLIFERLRTVFCLLCGVSCSQGRVKSYQLGGGGKDWVEVFDSLQ